jgi:hypothetical protein
VSGRGKPLELGVLHEANALLRSGRAALVRQFPRMAAGPGGTMRYAGEAPVDFLGARRGGASMALEAKETERESFPLDEDHLSRAQIKACRALAAMGVEVHLVIDFKRLGEVYALPWRAVDEFLAAPWRASLSLDWARAYGLLLPETDRDDTEKRRTQFLDGAPHAEQATALLRVQTERQSCAVISLDEQLAKDDARDQRWAERRAHNGAQGESLAQLMARKPAKDAPEADRQHWLDEYSARELEANHRRARQQQRGQAGTWKGGRG